MDKLSTVILHNNKIEVIEGLDGLVNLKHLELNNNQIKKITNLKVHKHLK